MGVGGGGGGVVGVLCWVLFYDRAEMRSSQGLVGNGGGGNWEGGGFGWAYVFFLPPQFCYVHEKMKNPPLNIMLAFLR